MSGVGTYRGTPNRGGGRGQLPFENSPSSIPRPKLETTQSTQQSDAGTSTLSSSRQKQSKRDEVSPTKPFAFPQLKNMDLTHVRRQSDARWRPTSTRRSMAGLQEHDTQERHHQGRCWLSSQARLFRSSPIPLWPKLRS